MPKAFPAELGGGDPVRNVSNNLVEAMRLAKRVGGRIGASGATEVTLRRWPTPAFLGSTIGARQSERWRKSHQTLQRLHEELIPVAFRELNERSAPWNYLEYKTSGAQMDSIAEVYRLGVYLSSAERALTRHLRAADAGRSAARDKYRPDAKDLAQAKAAGTAYTYKELPAEYAKACDEVGSLLNDLSAAVRARLERPDWVSRRAGWFRKQWKRLRHRRSPR